MLTLLALTALSAAGQYEIDRVCVGAERYYRIDGEAGSTYTWLLTDPFGTVTTLPEEVDTVTIIWNVPAGVYDLTNLQYGANGCDTTQLGYITVFEQPDAYAGENITLCAPDPLTLSQAAAMDYSALLWTTSGDGTFDDASLLNPTYTFGPNDIAAGGVILTLTAQGQGNTDACTPAISSLIVTINDLQAAVELINISCFGGNDGSVTLSASGGTEPYNYTLNGTSSGTGLFQNLTAGTYTYIITDAAGCETTGEVILTQPELLIAVASPLTAELCINESMEFFGSHTGGTEPPNEHQWIGSGALFLGDPNTENPVFNGTAPGTYSLFYTIIDANGCDTISGEVVITVLPEVEPAFAQIGPLCQNSIPPPLPSSSDEGITGTWDPPVINTSVVGLSTYTFTPDEGQCATATGMDITISPEITPTFTAIDPLCQNSTPPVLELTSLEGITGTWNPGVIDTGTPGTYAFTFTPDDPAQCGISVSIEIIILPEVIPTFVQIGPLCQNGTAPDLEFSSLEGITGTWSPAAISTTTAGTFTFTFTPDEGQCATTAVMEITIDPEVQPTFAAIGPLCINSTPPVLEPASLEGITGTWDPAVITTAAAGTFTFTFTPDPDQCALTAELTVTVEDEVIPTFDPIGPLCQNSTPPGLETTSLEGITGTWDPSVIATTTAGTFIYTFTPDEGQCASVTTLEIVIDLQIEPLFAQIGPLCQYSTPEPLPLTSDNGITGTWNPGVIDTGTPGTYTYTFTPTDALCATEVSMDITIDPQINPEFAQIGPLCQFETAPVLPLTSDNGITGTWNPPAIDTDVFGTFTYTFTPDEEFCAAVYTMDVEVLEKLTPDFAPIGPLCVNSTPPVLEPASPNGIAGTWNPAVINTTTSGITTYTFTPDAGQCAFEVTMDIEVTDEIVPTFDPIGPLCQNSAPPDLPLTSLEGFTGTWNPASISTLVNGTYTFEFTPDPDQCASVTTIDITITEELTPLFAQIGPLCQFTLAPDLPSMSQNDIHGTWNPLVIDTGTPGTFTYTFTPDAGVCAVVVTMDITIDLQITPEFAQIGPLCQFETAPVLPLTSDNGITGTWNPPAIDTDIFGTVTYTFTPDEEFCAAIVTMDIEVEEKLTPEFEPIGPLCVNSTPPVLEPASPNGIAGTWNPAVINTTTSGITTYTFTPDAGQCAFEVTMDIEVTDEIVPTFDPIGPLCQNSAPPDLPLTSLEGFTGTWNPASISTLVNGTYTFEFTPDPDQCASVTTIDITITEELTPLFAQIGPLCQFTLAPDLPSMSQNDIHGTWNPLVIDTGTPGTFTYTFTPDAGVCAVVVTMDITIDLQITPEFAQIGPLCQFETAPVLPLTSDNGITGTWNPPAIDTDIFGTVTYTFTPDEEFCAAIVTMDIEVEEKLTPEFEPIGPLCVNSAPPALPGVSVNGISGTWDPASISTGTIGFTTYRFFPDAGQCAFDGSLEIEVTDEILPEFHEIGPLCINSTPPELPLGSTNGISGSWNPAVINTSVLGTGTYTFTPDPDQCAVPVDIQIEIVDEIVPLFTQIGPLCQYEPAPDLPSLSENNVHGTWDPGVIDTDIPGTVTYTFTPDEGSCATVVTMDITVDPQLTPEFDPIGPLCQFETAPVLTVTSNNGITGTWDPAAINTDIFGTFTYTFTPDEEFCAAIVTMDIEVEEKLTPEFEPIGPLCVNSTAPVLQTVSLNGIPGSWNPAVINTAIIGSTTYTFTPDAGICAFVVTMEVEVTDEIIPNFAQIGPLCVNSTPPELLTVSINGITGIWNPAVINTSVLGTSPYVFTPDPGQCAMEITMFVEITDEIVPVFEPIGPLCQNSVAPTLPAISLNNLTGIWTPSVINTTNTGTFNFVFTPDAGQCAGPVTIQIVITDEITPTFAPIGPLCQNSTPPPLPPASLEGITGTWSPPAINTTAVGIYTYTFTPDDPSQCGTVTSITVEITDEIVPTFEPIGPLCQNSTPPDLPAVSLEGITGDWNPATISTLTVGTFTFTFTPDNPDQCGVVSTMDIVITDEIVPTFAQIGPLCLNSTPPLLPSVSLEGITGTWSPDVIDTSVIGIFTYTFTPDDPDQCGVVTTMEIEITDGIAPTFAQIGPLCLNSTPPLLPSVSLEGITGTWNPAVINTTSVGIVTYTFTPDNPDQCGLVTTMDIEITDEIVPTFAQIGPLCLNSTPDALPAVSMEGISGTWNPPVINTTAVGIFPYTFTPDDPAQCGVPVTINIEITDEIVPEFDPIDPLCFNSEPPALPGTSNNGITGTWTPAVIVTSVAGTTTYTFTPDPGQCAGLFSIDVTVNPEMVVLVTPTPASCPGEDDGSIVFSDAAGGSGSYDYSIDDGSSWQTGTTFAGLSSGDYRTWIRDHDDQGCEIFSGIVTVAEPDAVVATAEVEDATCGEENGSIAITATGGTGDLTYMLEGITGWQTAGLFENLAGGVYSVVIRDAMGCESPLDGIVVNATDGPEIVEIEITNAQNGLPNGSANVVANGTAPLQYSLDGINWQDESLFENLSVGTYTVWVRDANGCLTSREFEILNVVQGELVISAEEVTYCYNVPVIIPVDARDFYQVSSFIIELEFDTSILSFNGLVQINPALTGGTFSTSINGNVLQIRYSIWQGSATVQNGQQLFALSFDGIAVGNSELDWNWMECVIYSPGNDSIPAIYVNGQAEILPSPEILARGSGVYCEGDSLILRASDGIGELLDYRWTGPTGHHHVGNEWQLGSLQVLDGGMYEVIATNSYLCTDKDTVNVTVNPAPDIYIGYADTICFGQPLMLDPGGGFANYLWHDGSSMQTFMAYEPGVYWVNVEDYNGCRGTDTVAMVPCNIELLIPNAFTPNGDGLNDVFRPIFKGWEPTKYSMHVYTKWGQLVYEGYDPGEGWDGTVDGIALPTGTFAFVIAFEAPSYVYRITASPVTGSVTLLR
jgi:gliding motility-associated-like protein